MNKLLILIMLLFVPSTSNAGELRTRDDIKKLAQALFTSEQFEMLNETGTKYLNRKSRTDSGLWKLTLFYNGLKPNIDVRDPKYWSDRKVRAMKWSQLNEDSSHPRMVYAGILISEAWMYRGGGWARNVPKENWKPFHLKIEEAKQYLLSNSRFKNNDPQWYEQMLSIAKAQNWETADFNKLLNEALTAHPQFYEIYFRALNYFQPRWHGSTEEIEKFAIFATQKSEEHEGQGMYARIYWYASQAEYGHRLFTKSNVRWEQMKLGIKDVIKEYPDQWNINNFAVFACLAKDKAMTKKLLSMLKGRPIMIAWKHGSFFKKCYTWANQDITVPS